MSVYTGGVKMVPAHCSGLTAMSLKFIYIFMFICYVFLAPCSMLMYAGES